MNSQNYFISFVDKSTLDTNLIKSLLSHQSIERRKKQGIDFDLRDMPIKTNYLDSISSYGLKVKFKSKWENGVLVESSELENINGLKAKNFIKYIHSIKDSAIGGIQSINSIEFGVTVAIHDFFNTQAFYNNNNFGQERRIAIFDGGFDGMDNAVAFNSLFNEDRLIDRYNFVNPTASVYSETDHGTGVASIICGDQANVYQGLCPKSRIALFVTEDNNSETILEEYNWLFAAERADSLGIEIINSSLGYYDFDTPSTNHTFNELNGQTAVVSKAALVASQKGILVVNAAGNSNNSSIWPHINFPGDVSEVLTVGNISFDKILNTTSSRGPVNGSYVKPELVAPGTNIPLIKSNGTVGTNTGTSFSSPVIAGLAALVWNEYPEFTSQELKNFLIKNASMSDFPDQNTGYGFPITNKLLSLEDFSNNNTAIDSVYYLLNGIELKKEDLNSFKGFFIEKITFENGQISLKKNIKY